MIFHCLACIRIFLSIEKKIYFMRLILTVKSLIFYFIAREGEIGVKEVIAYGISSMETF